MAQYKVPLTKADKEKLKGEYYKLHLRNAPNNIGDETLIKSTNNEVLPEQPEQKGVQEQGSEQAPEASTGASQNPEQGGGDKPESGAEQPSGGDGVENPSQTPSADSSNGATDTGSLGANEQGGAGNGDTSSAGDGTGETPKAPEHLEVKELSEAEKAQLESLRKAYFALTGKPALDSMTIEQLSSEVQAINHKLSLIAQRENNERAKNVHSYSYDPSTQVLIEKNGEVRAYGKTTWEKFLSKSPDGWKLYIRKPLEIQ